MSSFFCPEMPKNASYQLAEQKPGKVTQPSLLLQHLSQFFSVLKVSVLSKTSFSFRVWTLEKWRLKAKDFALTLIAIKPKMISKMKISRRKESNCSSVPTVKLPNSAEKRARNRLGKKDTKNGVLASIIPRKIIIYTKIRNTKYQKGVRASQLL